MSNVIEARIRWKDGYNSPFTTRGKPLKPIFFYRVVKKITWPVTGICNRGHLTEGSECYQIDGRWSGEWFKNTLESVWNPSDPLEVPYSTNQKLVRFFFATWHKKPALKVSYFEMSFWCLQIYQKINYFLRISALAFKKRSTQKSRVR